MLRGKQRDRLLALVKQTTIRGFAYFFSFPIERKTSRGFRFWLTIKLKLKLRGKLASKRVSERPGETAVELTATFAGFREWFPSWVARFFLYVCVFCVRDTFASICVTRYLFNLIQLYTRKLNLLHPR